MKIGVQENSKDSAYQRWGSPRYRNRHKMSRFFASCHELKWHCIFVHFSFEFRDGKRKDS